MPNTIVVVHDFELFELSEFNVKAVLAIKQLYLNV